MLFAAETSSLDAHGRHVRRLVRGAAVALLLLATAARADDGNASAISEMSAEEASTAPASTRNSWYGWQILEDASSGAGSRWAPVVAVGHDRATSVSR